MKLARFFFDVDFFTVNVVKMEGQKKTDGKNPSHLVLHGRKPGAPPARSGSSLTRQPNVVLLGMRGNLGRRAAVFFFSPRRGREEGERKRRFFSTAALEWRQNFYQGFAPLPALPKRT